MTREEILKELNYKGKYNKEVKRKLKRLLKKYHPDNNKEDKETILVLYQIKKELETNTLVYDEVFEDMNRENAYKFCPNCGAKMIGPQESENKK